MLTTMTVEVGSITLLRASRATHVENTVSSAMMRQPSVIRAIRWTMWPTTVFMRTATFMIVSLYHWVHGVILTGITCVRQDIAIRVVHGVTGAKMIQVNAQSVFQTIMITDIS